ncbi:MAG: adenylate/guanylate cyclase domain-containing protein [Anaerolineales bacterium]|nr:adenylate/guanylate cyclase domain-containing protein [Anaerolineales bacterium]
MSQQISFRLLWLSLIAISLIFAVLLDAFGQATPLQRLELAGRDFLMRLRGVRPLQTDIVIVAIDDFSLHWTGYDWPWPRAYLAQIIRELNRAKPRLIGIDIFLFEADEDKGDLLLAQALEEAQATVGVLQIFQDESSQSRTLKQPLSLYRSQFDRLGLTGIYTDADAIVRSVQPFDRFDEQVYYHWAFEMASLLLEQSPPQLSKQGLHFNGQQVPLAAGRLLINYAGPPGYYPTYPAADVADGLIDPHVFQDKIVLIGATSLTLHDVYPTPYAPSRPMAGVEIVANVLNMVLEGEYLHLLPPWMTLLLIVLLAILANRIGRMQHIWFAIGAWLGTGLAYLLMSFLLFLTVRWYLPLIAPLTMLFLGAGGQFIERSVSQEREKQRIRTLFSRFLSPEMVEQLLRNRDWNALNKRAELTILFSDIRGFTTSSETMSPEALVHLLNQYLEAMTSVIHRHGGTVDKYEGDAIIAFFGEPVIYPDHACRAVQAALEMQRELARLNQGWQEAGVLRRHLEIGIGIHSGEVFVGLIGSKQRISYTVIGDNVNLASRIQDETKRFGWPILLSESVVKQLNEQFECEDLGEQFLRGRNTPIRLYKLLGCAGASPEESPLPLSSSSD